MIRVGVIGAGRWGPNLIRNFHTRQESVVVAVVDRDAARVAQVRSRFADVQVGDDAALVLADVYPAGEAPIVAADGRALARAVRVAGRVEPVFVEGIGDVASAIRDIARDGDVVVTMGAGSIGGVAAQLGGAA